MILGIEVAFQLSFLQKGDLRQPNMRLNIPLRFEKCCGCIEMMYKYAECVSFCLNISSKNTNHMGLGK